MWGSFSGCHGSFLWPIISYRAKISTSINYTEWVTQRGRRSAQLPLPPISFPHLKLPLHVLQGLVCAIFAHPPSFAITFSRLHTYKQASIVYQFLHHLTGKLNDSLASTFFVLLSFQGNFIKVLALLWCYAALFDC
jgi:hypothetical protein